MVDRAREINFSVDLSGRTALVTGAASGVGRAIATALGCSGATVLVNDLAPEQVAACVATIPGAEGFPGDITDRDFVQRVKGRAIDILVNNAGFQHIAPVEEFPPETLRRLLEVMLVAPYLLCQAVLPGMKARGFGRIVNISSVHGKIASAFKSGYVCAKHGLLGLTRAVAVESAACGVTANAICPGIIDTSLIHGQLGALAASHGMCRQRVLQEVLLRQVPLKRLLKPEEIAYLALFLCSDAAAGITAQGYTIDGGWSQV